MTKGIDYGLGQTNIDHASGIRYGVIHSHEVLQAWADSAEADYGDAHCPHCGNEARDASADGFDYETGEPLADDAQESYTCDRGACGDYACDRCRKLFDGESAFGDSPNGWTYDADGYKATQGGDDCDIFVLASPYYTRAAYCSPCAPGACYLASPCDDGEKAYCFGHDWFEDGVAPYPVYSVATGELVNP